MVLILGTYHHKSGASINVINKAIVDKYKLKTTIGPYRLIEFANRQQSFSSTICPIKLYLGKYLCTFEAAVLPINDDLILGTSFFSSLKEITINWKKFNFQFTTKDDKTYHLLKTPDTGKMVNIYTIKKMNGRREELATNEPLLAKALGPTVPDNQGGDASNCIKTEASEVKKI
jgi:hypothetical protein